jgi:hypothetical protein
VSFPWSIFDFGPFDDGETPVPPPPAPAVVDPEQVFPPAATSGDNALRDFWLAPNGRVAYQVSFTGSPGLAAVSGQQAVAQHLVYRLRLIKGEMPWDLDAGVDYFGIIFKKGATNSAIETEIARVILGTPGVSQLLSLVLNRTPQTRKLSVSFTAKGDLGTTTATVPLLEV